MQHDVIECNAFFCFSRTVFFLEKSRKTNRIDISCRSLYPKKSFFLLTVSMLTFWLLFVNYVCVCKRTFYSWSAFTQQISFVKYCHQHFIRNLFCWILFFSLGTKNTKNYQRMNGFCSFFKLTSMWFLSIILRHSPSLCYAVAMCKIFTTILLLNMHIFFTDIFFGIHFLCAMCMLSNSAYV